jgi:ectoine hydroxylase-related dioxygenase (phytanoyl-CoA dioxygenase family)
VWSSSIFPKKPHDPSYISFHQDGTYWGLGSTEVTTAWIALTPSTVESGCMRVAPGTHLDPIHPHVETRAENNMLTRGQEVQVEVDESRVLDIVLQPGEMSLHHVNIIHGSNPNGSDTKRVGFAIRYMTPRVRQSGDPNPVVLARGRDDFHHNELLDSPPAPANLDEAILRHQEAANKHLEALTRTEAATS